MYWQFNISTGREGQPECVLIRALEPIFWTCEVQNIKNLANGPGKLCRWMKLNKSFYGEDLTKSQRIWLEDGEEIKPSQIVASKRIGIDYAKEWAGKPWRFYIRT